MLNRITQSVVVLDLMGVNHEDVYARFSREPDDATDIPDELLMTTEKWTALGSPQQITVTIRPGDEVNQWQPRTSDEDD